MLYYIYYIQNYLLVQYKDLIKLYFENCLIILPYFTAFLVMVSDVYLKGHRIFKLLYPWPLKHTSLRAKHKFVWEVVIDVQLKEYLYLAIDLCMYTESFVFTLIFCFINLTQYIQCLICCHNSMSSFSQYIYILFLQFVEIFQ